MAFGSAYDPGFRAWGRMIAHQGVAVAVVDFRNCEMGGESKPEVKEFPAGPNDCYSALKWCKAYAAEIGADPARIIVNWESGGGNLTIATVQKKKEGRLELVQRGFFAMCPFLAAPARWAARATRR